MSSLLNKINFPHDLRKFSKKELPLIAKELRKELIDSVSTTGGHLGAGLGVVELTLAIHYIFDTIFLQLNELFPTRQSSYFS